MVNIKEITRKYYCCFINKDINDSDLIDNILYISSHERNKVLKGYGCRFTIFALIINNNFVVSYSPDKEFEMNQLKLNYGNQELIETFKDFHHRFLFEYQNLDLDIDITEVVVLSINDYEVFEIFFLKNNPQVKDISWLKDYFIEKTNKKYFTGIYNNGNLVCVCDAPDMPYMEDIIQHTGIVTLESERRKGYAKKVAYFTAKHLISLGVCPQWETTASNIASINLAKSIGYKSIAEAYILQEN